MRVCFGVAVLRCPTGGQQRKDVEAGQVVERRGKKQQINFVLSHKMAASGREAQSAQFVIE